MSTSLATNHQPLATSSVRDFITLMKPGVMSLVVFTGLAGMVLAPGHLHPLQQFLTLFCIALGSGAGAAINMWFDRDIDAVMRRTSKRPVPAGRVMPDDALAFGLFLGALSVLLMSVALNLVAGALLAFAIFFYAVIYTMILKRRTPQNIVIGGAAGAFPPVIGWAAVTGDVTLFPLILFSVIFLWTPPHFWALALYKNDDYTKAGVPMMPVVAGSRATRLQMVVYTWVLSLVTLLPFMLGVAGALYGAGAMALAVIFLFHVHRVQAEEGDVWARKTFKFSILYLFLLFSLMMADAFVAANMQP